MILRSARYLARDLLEGVVKPGGTVVDATAGNGRDTVYLAEKVGIQGHVYAFDVQRAALEATETALEQARLGSRVTLVLDSHENMERHVPGPVQAVLFNLGWLPGGDHRLTTRVESTLTALAAAMRLTAAGGVISLCLYPGHAEGRRELERALAFTQGLPLRQWNCLHAHFPNQSGDAPQLILLQREAAPTARKES